jgi:predicted dehydrogenase
VLLSTYHNRHWDGCIVQALRTLRTGVIGDLVRVDMHTGGWSQPRDWWRSSKRLSGGILYDWGVHLLEYALQIVQADIREVSGFAHRGFWAPRTAWKGDTVEDDAFLVVRFSSGVWCTLGMSHVESRPRPGWVDITGTKGSYIMEGANWELITHDEGVTVSRRGVNPPSAWWRFYRNLADHLTRGASLVITPEWARRPIHILDLADRSARLGRALPARYA